MFFFLNFEDGEELIMEFCRIGFDKLLVCISDDWFERYCFEVLFVCFEIGLYFLGWLVIGSWMFNRFYFSIVVKYIFFKFFFYIMIISVLYSRWVVC